MPVQVLDVGEGGCGVAPRREGVADLIQREGRGSPSGAAVGMALFALGVDQAPNASLLIKAAEAKATSSSGGTAAERPRFLWGRRRTERVMEVEVRPGRPGHL